MKKTMLLLMLMGLYALGVSQDTLGTQHLVQPQTIKEVEGLGRLDEASIVYQLARPKVMVYRNQEEDWYMAVGTQNNGSTKTDVWQTWPLPFEYYNIYITNVDTLQLNGKGQPELIITWSHDEGYGGGWYGGYHLRGTQLWDLDKQRLIWDMLNHESSTSNENDSANFKVTVEHYACNQTIEVSNQGINVNELESDGCEALNEVSSKLVSGSFVEPGFYRYQDGKWIRRLKPTD